MPGIFARSDARTAENGTTAALGEKRLLERAGHGVRPGDPRQLVAYACRAVPELGAQPPQQRRGCVAKVGAVLLDRAVDRRRDGVE